LTDGLKPVPFKASCEIREKQIPFGNDNKKDKGDYRKKNSGGLVGGDGLFAELVDFGAVGGAGVEHVAAGEFVNR
jgi:hypothetical protein